MIHMFSFSLNVWIDANKRGGEKESWRKMRVLSGICTRKHSFRGFAFFSRMMKTNWHLNYLKWKKKLSASWRLQFSLAHFALVWAGLVAATKTEKKLAYFFWLLLAKNTLRFAQKTANVDGPNHLLLLLQGG